VSGFLPPASDSVISFLEKNPRKHGSIQERDWDENDRIRDEHYQIDKALDTLDIKPGMTVGEVGAGEGFIVFKLAERVGPAGKVYAEDISKKRLDILKIRMTERNYRNIEIIVEDETEPKLPKGILDFVFMHATIIFVDDPIELFNNIAPSLKPGGKLVVMEQEKSRAVSLSGKPVPDMFRSKEEYLDLFAQTVFRVDRIYDKIVPHDIVIVLSVRDGARTKSLKKPCFEGL
jgi:ubiquinone/menaquinone biosynthesis C-methylase UbiE